MSERCLCQDFELRGVTYELWIDGRSWYLADPVKQAVVDDDDFSPRLSDAELGRINDYVHDRQ